MTTITILSENKTGKEWTFEVVVKDDKGEKSFLVKCDTSYLKKLRVEKSTPQELLHKSFLFLLDRESKEEILSSFNLSDIQRYFPEYEEEIRR